MATTISKMTLSFGLVSIPIKISAAARGLKAASFNLLHAACGCRINMLTHCNTCDMDITRADTVKGYEYEKEKYVQVTDADLEAIEPESNKVMEITAAVEASEIDPILFETSYYLEPEPAGKRGYKLLLAALEKEKKVAIAKVTMHGHEQVIVIRAYRGALMFHTMYYADEIRSMPDATVADVEIKPAELKLACQLLNVNEETFNHAQYRDEYRGAVEAMLEAKVSKGPIPITKARKQAAPAGDMESKAVRSIFPDVHFGAVGEEPTPWRPDDTPDDDAELFPTPADVVGILGFDPLELDSEPEPVPDKMALCSTDHMAKRRQELPEIAQARQQLQSHVLHFFQRTAKEIADHFRGQHDKLAAAQQDELAKATPGLPPIRWDDLVPDLFGSLNTIARTSGRQALAELNISDSGMLSDVNEVARDWADRRAAELVGMKRLPNGRLVQNPDAKWVITDKTRDDLQEIIANAFDAKTDMRDLADEIQQAGAFSEYRAALIASNETKGAMEQGNLEGWKASGMVRKLTCQQNSLPKSSPPPS